MIGSANAEYVDCCFNGTNIIYGSSDVRATQRGALGSTSGVDCTLGYILPIPKTRGGLKLYATKIRLELMDADADDYVDSVEMYGLTNAGQTAIAVTNGTTNRTAAGSYEYDLTASPVDLSSYTHVAIQVVCVFTGNLELDVLNPSVKVYYDS